MFRIVKRESVSRLNAFWVRLCGIAIGVVLSGAVIGFLGHPIFQTFYYLINGAFGSVNAFRNTLIFTIPLAITALGLSVAFKMRFWNIGGEGQFLMGATFAMFVSLNMPENTPGILLIALMFMAGFLGGAIWAVIPGIFRVKIRANETLFTLMMNYLALFFVQYLYYELWRDTDRQGFPGMKNILPQAYLPTIMNISVGIFVPIILMVVVYILIQKTKLGYEIRVVGESEPTAHYAGINVKKVILTGVIISGGNVGLAGVVKLTGSTGTLSSSLAGGAGFTAIVISWLAGLSAPIIILVSFLFGALEQGAQMIQLRLGVPAAVANIIKGLILMSAVGSEFFLRYQLVLSNKKKTEVHANSNDSKSEKVDIQANNNAIEEEGESS